LLFFKITTVWYDPLFNVCQRYLIRLNLIKKYFKNKKLFLGIKSGAKGSEVELFWARFSYF
jgi:hypothetical protein